MKVEIIRVGAGLFGLLFALSGLANEVEYSYDQAGRLVRVRYGGNTTLYYVYDLNGNQLQRITETFFDGDGDGMDDDKELTYFLTTARNGNGDFDGDGQSDFQEFLARTDPTNSADYLHLSEVEVLDKTAMTISWTTVPGNRYQLQFSDTLENNSWQSLGPVVTATSPTSTFIDVIGLGQKKRFYRALVIDP